MVWIVFCSELYQLRQGTDTIEPVLSVTKIKVRTDKSVDSEEGRHGCLNRGRGRSIEMNISQL
jgi:hypothetical protein